MTRLRGLKSFPWREAAPGIALWIFAVAAFPRLAFVGIRAAMRRGVRGVLAYIAVQTAIRATTYLVALPHGRRVADRQEQLRQQLGREPTPDEYARHFGYVD